MKTMFKTKALVCLQTNLLKKSIMNKNVWILLVVLLLTQSIVKTQWTQISQVGNNELRGVKFFNEHTGITVGQGGIWRSTNSGVNWFQVWNGQTINSLSFTDNNTGYAAGDSGKVLKTIDSGINWTILTTGTIHNLKGISFANSSTGWAVGSSGTIIRTINGGITWQPQTAQFTLDYNGIIMINASMGYVYGGANEEAWVYTANSGLNWLYTLNNPGNTIQCGSFNPGAPSNIVYTGSSGRIRKSTNNGLSWSVLTSGTAVKLNTIQFADASTIYIAGDLGTILISTNSGSNWSFQNCNTTNNLKSITLLNPGIGWLVGENGTVLRLGIPLNISNAETQLPEDFELHTNYPNPFNSETKIHFSLPHLSKINLSIYNILGENIITLANGIFNAGNYMITWNAENSATGIYFCKFSYDKRTVTKKMSLIK